MTATYNEHIERTKSGDASAFGDVVREFQDMAFAVAYSWLGEPEAAKDVAQDAFLEAFERLDQLRDTRAFPGWFKRIVIKHCDRATRRKPFVWEPNLEDQDDPFKEVSDAQMRRHVRAIVEALPPKERIAIALQYFAELTGPEIAELMEIPLSTVKKRLRTARARLRQIGEIPMIDKQLTAPSTLSITVMFFIGIRKRDHELVKRLLRKTPSLANATQSWDPQIAEEGTLPHPNQATALIVAVELDDLQLLEILLSAGADPDGMCGCRTAETPLWAAALFNRPAHAERLLMAQANPNLPSSAGNYPLHLAAMRGHEEVVKTLLKHGADSALVDSGPMWPGQNDGEPRDAADWAAAKGHKRIVKLIKAAPTKLVSSNAKSEDSVSICDGVVHTGIKCVDLFVPIPHGGLTRIVAEANAGVVTLLGEFSRRWFDSKLGRVIWSGFPIKPIDKHDWEADLDELGLKNLVEFSMGSLAQDEEQRLQKFDEAIASAEKGEDETLLIAISNPGFAHYVEASFAKITANKRITCLVVVPKSSVDDRKYFRPYAAQLRLDPIRTKRLLLPSVDPAWSSSQLSSELDVERIRLTERARKIIANYVTIDPDLDDVYSEDENPGAGVARELFAYLRQPFYVTEPFTGTDGEFVVAAELLEKIAAITAD